MSRSTEYDAHVQRWADWAEGQHQPSTLLSIAIPTFNREDDLRELLTQLIRECAPYRVPIYVSDNASPYDFDALIACMRSRYPYIYAHRNPRNLGLGANVLAAAAMPDTEYIWLFSDDDRLALGAVKFVLQSLASRADLIMPERELRTAELKFDKGKTYLRAGEQVAYIDAAALLKRAAVSHFTFLGCLVFRRSRWRLIQSRYADDPYFPQVSILAEMMAQGGTALFLPERLVYVRGGSGASWSADALRCWWYYLPRAIWRVPGYSRRTKLRALSRAWNVQLYALWLTLRRLLTWRSDRSADFVWGVTLGAFIAFVMVALMVQS